MRLSTRTRYGMRALLELALGYGYGPLSLKTIAERQDISLKYLEQLVTVLKAAGLVNSIRGAKGGYVLARSPEQINLSDCVNCLEGGIAAVECVEDKSFCKRTADCVMNQIWSSLTDAMENILKSMTLKDLVEKSKKSTAINYHI